MRIVWSIVSNAEERSSSASIVPFLLSRLVRISLDIFASAVSVDLQGRYEGFCVILNKTLVVSRRFVPNILLYHSRQFESSQRHTFSTVSRYRFVCILSIARWLASLKIGLKTTTIKRYLKNFSSHIYLDYLKFITQELLITYVYGLSQVYNSRNSHHIFLWII